MIFVYIGSSIIINIFVQYEILQGIQEYKQTNKLYTKLNAMFARNV
jgi:hypothetical protein